MKVAYVTLAPFVSGAERCLQLILQNAPTVGIKPVVICPPGSALIPWCNANSIPQLNIPLADRDKRHPLRWFSSVGQIGRALWRERIEVLHSNQVWSFAAAGAAAGYLGIPRVCHMRDVVSSDATRWWCKSGVESIVCVSSYVASVVAPAWPDGVRPPITTLIDPVPIAEIDARDAEHTRSALQQRLGLEPTTLLFGFIGQIAEVKGLLELLEAFGGLVDRRGWHLLVAGRDPRAGQPYERECRARIAALGLGGRISFLGFIDHVRDFYDTIDVAVVPSREEPLGLVPLEAASRRKSSIAFAVGGLPETIEDGQTGWLVPSGNVPALRRALVARMDAIDESRVAGARAYDRVRTLGAPERYMQRLAELYAGLQR